MDHQLLIPLFIKSWASKTTYFPKAPNTNTSAKKLSESLVMTTRFNLHLLKIILSIHRQVSVKAVMNSLPKKKKKKAVMNLQRLKLPSQNSNSKGAWPTSNFRLNLSCPLKRKCTGIKEERNTIHPTAKTMTLQF